MSSLLMLGLHCAVTLLDAGTCAHLLRLSCHCLAFACFCCLVSVPLQMSHRSLLQVSERQQPSCICIHTGGCSLFDGNRAFEPGCSLGRCQAGCALDQPQPRLHASAGRLCSNGMQAGYHLSCIQIIVAESETSDGNSQCTSAVKVVSSKNSSLLLSQVSANHLSYEPKFVRSVAFASLLY